MELNRNHYFAAGVVLLIVGLQFRMVDSFVLTEKTTQFLAERLPQTRAQELTTPMLFLPAPGLRPKKIVTPPKWIGWAFLAVGAVLVLHALAMKKPGQ